MNGLPSTVDLTPLKNKRIEQICFGAWVVIFNIEGGIRIAVEGDCAITSAAGLLRRIEDCKTNATDLCRFVGSEVQDAERDANGGLTLKFRAGETLHILNSRDAYESFQLHIGDHVYVA